MEKPIGPIQAVFFDFFDVIHKDYQKAWLAEKGHTRSGGFAEASDLLDVGSIDVDEYLARFAEHGGVTIEELRADFDRHSVLDEAVVDVIRDIRRQQYKVGLISNAHPNELRPILDRHQLPPLFHDIVISGEVGVAKPSDQIFHLSLRRLGVLPQHSVMIDDSSNNISGAREVGMQGIVHDGNVDRLLDNLRAIGIEVKPNRDDTANAA